MEVGSADPTHQCYVNRVDYRLRWTEPPMLRESPPPNVNPETSRLACTSMHTRVQGGKRMRRRKPPDRGKKAVEGR